MKQAAGHGTVKLGWGHGTLTRDIMDTVDEGAALAAVPRRIGRELGSPACASVKMLLDIAVFRAFLQPLSRSLLVTACAMTQHNAEEM